MDNRRHHELVPPLVHHELVPPLVHHELVPPLVHHELVPPLVHDDLTVLFDSQVTNRGCLTVVGCDAAVSTVDDAA